MKSLSIRELPLATIKSMLLISAVILLLTGLVACKKEEPKQKYSDLIARADSFLEKDKLDEARISLLAAIDLKPNEAETYYKLAEVLIRLKKFGAAVERYQTTINLDPSHRDARLRLGALMLAAEEPERAESHIMSLLEKNPDDVDALLIQSSLHSVRKKFGQAKETLNRVLKLSPDNGAAIASLADIAQREGNFEEAEKLFIKARELEPDSEPIKIAVADLYTKQGRFEDAEEIIKGVLEKNPENSSLRYFFGEFLVERGLLDRAITQYEETIDTSPRQFIARDRLFDAYLHRGRTEEAKALALSLEEKLPEDPATAYFKGRVAELEGEKEKALSLYLQAVESMSGFSPAFRRAGLVEFALGKRAEGIEHLNQAIAINPVDVGARLALARDQFYRGELGIATEHVNKILQRYPRQIGANMLLADIALVKGDLRNAEKIFNLLQESFPDSPNPLFKLALVNERRRDFDKALDYYRKALAIDRDVFVGLKRYAELLARRFNVDAALKDVSQRRESSKHQAEYDVVLGLLHSYQMSTNPEAAKEARIAFNRAVEQRPDLLSAYFGLARLDSLSQDHQTAIASYEKIIAKEPKHIPSQMLLALSYEQIGQFSEAAKRYEAILEFSPRFGPAANNLAWLLAEELNGDLNKALRLAQIAKETSPNEAAVADTLGWIYYKNGSARSALPILEEAVQLARQQNSENGEIFLHLAIVQKELGKIEESKESAQQAQQLVQPNTPLYDKISKFISSGAQ